jgi:hypothetical protein
MAFVIFFMPFSSAACAASIDDAFGNWHPAFGATLVLISI